jgi:hypothetical protein
VDVGRALFTFQTTAKFAPFAFLFPTELAFASAKVVLSHH